MAKQMVEVDVPDGWEAVAFGKVKRGECFLGSDGSPDVYDVLSESVGLYVIVRRKHVWPEWLAPGWVAVDSNGAVWWYESEPTLLEEIWNGSVSARLDAFCKHGWLTLPPLDEDWTKNIWEVRHDSP